MSYRVFLFYLVVVGLITGCSKEKTMKSYYSDGNLKSEWTFAKDTLTGKKINYWHNGTKKSVYSVVDGAANGEYIQFHEKNGFVSGKLYYVNGVKRGKGIWYSSDREGLVTLEHYYLDVMGNEVSYYIRMFDSEGKLRKEMRSLLPDFKCDDGPSMTLQFVDVFSYDSVQVITGGFSENFSIESAHEVDTLRSRQLPLNISLTKANVKHGVIRGKCIFYQGTRGIDSTRMEVRSRYFEERVPEACSLD
jgi:hypothetical protein